MAQHSGSIGSIDFPGIALKGRVGAPAPITAIRDKHAIASSYQIRGDTRLLPEALTVHRLHHAAMDQQDRRPLTPIGVPDLSIAAFNQWQNARSFHFCALTLGIPSVRGSRKRV